MLCSTCEWGVSGLKQVDGVDKPYLLTCLQPDLAAIIADANAARTQAIDVSTCCKYTAVAP